MQTYYYLGDDNDITKMELTKTQLNEFQGSGSFYIYLENAEAEQSHRFYQDYEPSEESEAFDMSNSEVYEEQFVPLTQQELDEIPF